MAEHHPAVRIRPALPQDASLVAKFLDSEPQVHRHLDWRTPIQWLGYQPYFLLERMGSIQAVLACPVDPPGVAWLRVFASGEHFYREYAWKTLFEAAEQSLPKHNRLEIAAICLQAWFKNLLEWSGFRHTQDIVVLEWGDILPAPRRLPDGMSIRPMVPTDLGVVAELDKLAFMPLWHNSQDSLQLAFEQSAFCSVAERDGRLVGYQISTAIPLSGHLARLAVHPAIRGANIGYELARQVLVHFKSLGAWRVSVNTQADNRTSLALYDRLGFMRTDDTFPVYVKTISSGQTPVAMAK